MKKEEVIRSIKIIMIGLFLSLGIGLVSAWYPPAGLPGVVNATPPLLVDSAGQTKAGDLSIAGINLVTSTGLSTSGLLSRGNIYVTDLQTSNSSNPVCADSTGKLKKCVVGVCSQTIGQCTSGNVSGLTGSGNGPYNWTCQAVGGTANCSVTKGKCQSSSYQSTDTQPPNSHITSLCDSGTPSSVTVASGAAPNNGSNYWIWSCNSTGSNAYNVSCGAPRELLGSDGICGTETGYSYTPYAGEANTYWKYGTPPFGGTTCSNGHILDDGTGSANTNNPHYNITGTNPSRNKQYWWMCSGLYGGYPNYSPTVYTTNGAVWCSTKSS